MMMMILITAQIDKKRSRQSNCFRKGCSGDILYNHIGVDGKEQFLVVMYGFGKYPIPKKVVSAHLTNISEQPDNTIYKSHEMGMRLSSFIMFCLSLIPFVLFHN